MRRRILSALLALTMFMSMFPAGAVASVTTDNDGLCPHHAEHTEDCGYIPAGEGAPCAHEHTEDCFALTEECAHEHDESCGYAEPVDGVPCGYVCEICSGLTEETEAPEGTEEITEVGTLSNADIMPMVFVTGVIPAEMFEISGLPESVDTDAFLAGWSYTADGKPIATVPMRPDGTTPASRFPEYPGYHFVNVTIDNVVATQLGVLQLSEFLGARGERYYYLTHTSGSEYETSSTVLEEGQKFTINYALDEYDISYEVKMADDSDLPDGVTLDSTFGVGRPVTTANHAYSFDVRIPYGYTARVYRYWTDGEGTEQYVELTGEEHPEHNGGYPLGTEPVYVQVDNSNVKADESQGPKSMLVNDTFYDNNVTEHRDIVVELTKSDAPVFNASQWLHTVYAGGSKSGRGGTAAADFVWEDHYAAGNHADIKPEDNYSWGSLYDGPKDMTQNANGTYNYSWTFQTSGSGAGEDGFFLDTLEVNGQDLVVPFFPRETDPDGDLIGFNPENGRGVGKVEGQSYTVTTLPDGARVRLDYLYVFHGTNNCNQRVYRLTVTGATCNVTVTGGNLMMYGNGAYEFVTYSLVGVHADGDAAPDNRAAQHPAIQAYWLGSGWTDRPMSNVVVAFPYVGDTDHYGATIRFKLADGYSNPYYSFESTRAGVINGTDGTPQASIERDADGNVTSQNGVLPLHEAGKTLDTQHIYGPDADGWYYIRVTTQGQDNTPGSADYHKMALLYIVATPTKYVVRYLPGKVENPEDGTMPEFVPSASGWDAVSNSRQYDDNGGNYYDVVTNNVITIDGRVPIDPEQTSSTTGKIFQYWTLVGMEKEEDGTYKPLNDDIRIYPGQALPLEDESTELVGEGGYSISNAELGGADIDVRVLRLQAVWAPTPDKFSYSVYIEYIDEHGVKQRVEVPADIVDTENDYHAGEKLIVGINLDAPVFGNWLKDHPYYHFAAYNQDVHEIDDGGEIVITFERKNGSLILEKNVVGDPGDNDTFTFVIDAPDNLNENFLAWPMDIPENQRTEEDMIVIHFDNGRAQVQLKGGDRIALYIPPGDYTITEENIGSADYRVNIDGTDIEDGKPAQTTKTVVFDQDTGPVVFTNIFSNAPLTGNLIVKKTVTGTASETDRAFHFEATIGSRTYEFTLKDGESWTSGAFAVGTEYTVTEIDADEDGYTTTVPDNATGTIQGNQTVTVEIINHKDATTPPTPSDPTGRLTVAKTVTGSAGEMDREFHFKVTIGSATYEFTLRGGESWTSEDFIAGTEYTVTEKDANEYGYITTVPTNATGTIQGNQTMTVEFVNNKEGSEPGTDPDPGTDPEPGTDPDPGTDPEPGTDPTPDTNPTDPPVSPPLDDVPQTGDESQIGLWMTLMLLSLAGIVITLSSQKKMRLFSSTGRHTK